MVRTERCSEAMISEIAEYDRWEEKGFKRLLGAGMVPCEMAVRMEMWRRGFYYDTIARALSGCMFVSVVVWICGSTPGVYTGETTRFAMFVPTPGDKDAVSLAACGTLDELVPIAAALCATHQAASKGRSRGYR